MRLFFLLATILFSLFSHAVIYGLDHRQEVISSKKTTVLAQSIAMMVSDSFIEQKNSSFDLLNFLPLTESPQVELCSEERFSTQPANPLPCTGFLVAPDVLVTAGHCMMTFPGSIENASNEWCQNFSWVLDYHVDANGQVETKNIPATKLLKCEKIIYATLKNKKDFAVVKLQQKTTDRVLQKIATNPVRLGNGLSSIGYPTGLPAKYVGHANVLQNSHPNFFRSYLDVLGGQSGSPVFNHKNEVVGILVRAFPSKDYIQKPGKTCQTPNMCNKHGRSCLATDEETVGTEIQRIEQVLPWIKK